MATYDDLMVDIGNAPNDDQGDPLRTAFYKINQRFAELRVFLNNRGDWAPNTAYTANPNRDWVIVDGVGYLATSNHTSGATFAADLAAGKWVAADALLAIAEVDTLRDDLASTAAGKGAELVGFKQSGAGAVQRTVEDELRQWVSVKQFGAVGDGSVDDAPTVLLARAASPALEFTGGSFRMGSQVNLGKGTFVSDASASIKGYGFKIGGVDPSGLYRASMRDFLFDGTGTTGAANGALNIDQMHKGGFYDIRIENYTGAGNSSPLIVRQSWLSSFYNLSVQGNAYGPTFYFNCNNVAIYQGTFANNTAFGAYVRTSQKLVFNACDFEANGGGGLTIDNINQGTEASCSSVTVRDCYFEINGGADIRIGTGSGGDTTTVKDTIIKDNFFTGPGTYAIIVDYSYGAVIEDNYFVPTAYSQKDILLSGNSKNTTIIPFVPSRVQVNAGATVSTRTIQTGEVSFDVNASGFGSTSVTFPVPYETIPNIQVTMKSIGAPGVTLGVVQAVQCSTTGFTIEVHGAHQSIFVGANWRAGS